MQNCFSFSYTISMVFIKLESTKNKKRWEKKDTYLSHVTWLWWEHNEVILRLQMYVIANNILMCFEAFFQIFLKLLVIFDIQWVNSLANFLDHPWALFSKFHCHYFIGKLNMHPMEMLVELELIGKIALWFLWSRYW